MNLNELAIHIGGVGLLIVFCKVVILAFFVGVAWWLTNAITPFDDNEMMFGGRVPDAQAQGYMILRFGFVAGQIFGMRTSLDFQRVEPQWSDLIWLTVSGVVVLALLLVAYVILSYMIGHNEPVGAAPEPGTLASYAVEYRLSGRELRNPQTAYMGVQLVKASFFVAIGLIVGGAFDGNAPDYVTAFWATTVFIVLGIVVLVAWYFIGDLASTYLFGYSIRANVREGKKPACYEAAAVVLTQGIVMAYSISGDFTGWEAALKGFFVTLGLTIILAYGFRWVFDRVVMTDHTIADLQAEDNGPVAAFVAALMPLSALAVIPLATSFALLVL